MAVYLNVYGEPYELHVGSEYRGSGPLRPGAVVSFRDQRSALDFLRRNVALYDRPYLRSLLAADGVIGPVGTASSDEAVLDLLARRIASGSIIVRRIQATPGPVTLRLTAQSQQAAGGAGAAGASSTQAVSPAAKRATAGSGAAKKAAKKTAKQAAKKTTAKKAAKKTTGKKTAKKVAAKTAGAGGSDPVLASVDTKAQAATLKRAAKNGAAFCEECKKPGAKKKKTASKKVTPGKRTAAGKA